MKYISIYFCCVIFFISCKKDWLDAKPSNALVVPSKISDFQALLDDYSVMNTNYTGALGEVSAGDFTVSYSSYLSFDSYYRNAYVWSSTDNFYEGGDPFWSSAYQRILSTNLALEGISGIERTSMNSSAWNNVKGSALFFRALNFFELAQEYCNSYSNTANIDLGIPLRVVSDLNVKSTRATVAETYKKIIEDLVEAQSLLPVKAQYKSRPSQASVFALLARVYLSMGDYSNAFTNADACLKLYNDLLDYSSLDLTVTNPVPQLNKEVIFQSSMGGASPFSNSNMKVVPELLTLYDVNDLRLKVFFDNSKKNDNISFRGSYDGSRLFFTGLAVDEVLLIRSECNTRKGNLAEALKDLNDLLKMRWSSNVSYVEYNTLSKEDALTKILQERRKELCFRGIRWMDLRRLNHEQNLQVTLRRTLNNQVFNLLPNSVLYTFPIDPKEIRINQMVQNPRN